MTLERRRKLKTSWAACVASREALRVFAQGNGFTLASGGLMSTAEWYYYGVPLSKKDANGNSRFALFPIELATTPELRLALEDERALYDSIGAEHVQEWNRLGYEERKAKYEQREALSKELQDVSQRLGDLLAENRRHVEAFEARLRTDPASRTDLRRPSNPEIHKLIERQNAMRAELAQLPSVFDTKTYEAVSAR